MITPEKLRADGFLAIKEHFEVIFSKRVILLGDLKCYFHGFISDNFSDLLKTQCFIQVQSFKEEVSFKASEMSFSKMMDTLSEAEFLAFIKDLIAFAENELASKSYQIRIVSKDYVKRYERSFSKISKYQTAVLNQLKYNKNLELENAWFIMILSNFFYDTRDEAKRAAPNPFNDVKENEYIVYTDKGNRNIQKAVTYRDLVLRENKELKLQTVFDAQGRSVYVVVSKKRVDNVLISRQTQLSQSELYSMWKMCVEASRLRIEDGQEKDYFLSIRINAGAFQNISSIHYKVFMSPAKFKRLWKDNSVYQKLRRS